MHIETFDNTTPKETMPLIFSYFEWAKTTLSIDPKAAWDYQQQKINSIEAEVAKAICNGQGNLKQTIYDLKEFIDKDIELIAKLDAEIAELKERLNEQEDSLTQL